MPGNDNEPDRNARVSATAAHGAAALILVESLIHGLVERDVLSTASAVEIIERARDVQFDVAETITASDDVEPWRSHALLVVMAESLKRDLPD